MPETLAQAFVRMVHEDLLQVKQPHFDIAFRLSEAKSYGYAEQLGYSSIYELSEAEFGFKRSSTAAYISVCEAYMSGMQVAPRYKEYSFSQLVEMLPMDAYDRNQIKPTMTVKEIRQWRKNHKLVTMDDGRCVLYGELTERERKQLDNRPSKTDASKQEEVNESVQTSGQQDLSLPGADLPQAPEPIEVHSVVQPQKSRLLSLKNQAERAAWLKTYKDWGVWLTVPELNIVCYKYVFANGHELVAMESAEFVDWLDNRGKRFERLTYILLNDKISFVDIGGLAKTYVIDYMTEHAKEI